ncbi:HNH endonuclease family protein [Sphaerisporangium sp. TRM90804]|uniref:HNH endonuclease family protein n=1 Tax=Sphaerisporangium sp. TRM90804 TaxID=3031113 RepID=UPI00244AC4A5|nr:HNH endonuclease family protein [Sphaerisporangium sp. TRM90804]MDH2425134.1 HNH endonuclease family protein [Sphaerisporangium sp. TRM90804]
MAGFAAVVMLSGCGPIDATSAGGDGGSGSGDGGGSSSGVIPLDNPKGTEPGLAPIKSGKDRTAAVNLIEKVATKGRGPKTGYDRDEFGYAWADNAVDVPFARNGCDTRNDVLARDGQKLKYRSGSSCVLTSMTLDDPYTGRTIEWTKQDAAEVQIDHVMPLSYNWQMGASRWSKEKRVRIANDPLNLMPVDGSTNSSKGDSGPASWLPPAKGVRCSYAVRFAQVALKYDLAVTAADKDAMLAQCA